MLERKFLGEIPPRPHKLYSKNGKTYTEFVFTRDGFSGGFSILYGLNPPTSILSANLLKPHPNFVGEEVGFAELPIARRHFQPAKLPAKKHLLDSRTALFSNATCRLSNIHGSLNDESQAFCNGDADELYFAFEGEGSLLSIFGRLEFKKHDYVLIPRGVPYIIQSGISKPLTFFLMEGPWLEIPQDFKNASGQLKLEAPYTHRDFRSPDRLLTEEEAERFKSIVTLKNNTLTEHKYTKSFANTSGWDGCVYPIAFSVHDYLPKTGRIHLPPNLHLTFKSKGFVVCSFVPRMVDYEEGAIPCPYPHANHFCDEILYYVSGDFTSRAGIAPESISYHPSGVPHGPQPGKYLKSVGHKSTTELAVMVDTWEPLKFTKANMQLEDPSYITSWKE